MLHIIRLAVQILVSGAGAVGTPVNVVIWVESEQEVIGVAVVFIRIFPAGVGESTDYIDSVVSGISCFQEDDSRSRIALDMMTYSVKLCGEMIRRCII